MAAGDLEFKIFKDHEYHRGNNAAATPDQPVISGWNMLVTQSSASPQANNDEYWSFPHVFMTDAIVDPDANSNIRNPGVQVIPDRSPSALLIDFGLEVQDAVTSGYRRGLSAAVANPLPVHIAGDFALCMEFVGGESDEIPSSALNGIVSQHVNGSWQDGETAGGRNGYTHDQFGFSDNAASSASISYQTSNLNSFQFNHWFSFATAQPSMSIASDYGKRRATPAALRGDGLGAYHCDGVSTAFTLNYGVQAGTAFANGQAIPLMNFAPAEFPAAIPLPIVPGSTIYIYLDPNDPLFAAVSSSLVGALDANGNFRPLQSAQIPFATLPAALLGWFWSWEVVVVDQAFSAVANTERRGIKIEN